jgi:hypothetical protein
VWSQRGRFGSSRRPPSGTRPNSAVPQRQRGEAHASRAWVGSFSQSVRQCSGSIPSRKLALLNGSCWSETDSSRRWIESDTAIGRLRQKGGFKRFANKRARYLLQSTISNGLRKAAATSALPIPSVGTIGGGSLGRKNVMKAEEIVYATNGWRSPKATISRLAVYFPCGNIS